MYLWADWMAGALRDEGIAVVEEPGWARRGLAGGVFEPKAVVWHHDASPPGDSPGVPAYLVRNFNTASAQCWVSRQGVWHLIGAGRAPHAGVVLPGKPSNSTSIGVETDHTVNEGWTDPQLASLRKGTAALLRMLNAPALGGLEFHRSICSPVGRKIDPAGLDLANERSVVQQLILGSPLAPAAPAIVPPPAVPVAPPTPSRPAGPQHGYRQGKKVYSSKMHYGQRGSDSVWNLQVALIARGYPIPDGPTDNYLGQTRAACAQFQRETPALAGDPDGIAGPKTAASLGLTWVVG